MGGGISLNGKTILDYIYPIGSLYMSKENISPACLIGGVWEEQQSILIPKNKIYKTIIHNHTSYPTANYLIAYTTNKWANESSYGTNLYNNWGGGNYAKFLSNNSTLTGLNLGVDLSSDVETLYIWRRVEG